MVGTIVQETRLSLGDGLLGGAHSEAEGGWTSRSSKCVIFYKSYETLSVSLLILFLFDLIFYYSSDVKVKISLFHFKSYLLSDLVL